MPESSKEKQSMKRVGNLYSKIASRENIELAYINARKGKAHYTDVQKIDKNPALYLDKIEKMLKGKKYNTSEYVVIKRNDYGKERIIHKLPFYPDRIVHHAICQVLTPIWNKSYIRDTYACIKGRGIHDGVKRVKKALKDAAGTKYCLKLDIRKYYPSIDHDTLIKILQSKIKCNDTMDLLEEIIRSTEGIPIGNYISQHFANVYLSGIDHYAKEVLRLKYYFRYADDIVILSNSKEHLHKVFRQISNQLNKIKLTVKGNYQIFPVSARGIDFLGYRFYHTHTLLRKAIKAKMGRKIRKLSTDKEKLDKSMASYWGWMKWCNSYNLKRAYGFTQV